MFSQAAHPSFDPSQLALLQRAFSKASNAVSPKGYEERWRLANAILTGFSDGICDEAALAVAAVKQLNTHRTAGRRLSKTG
jgi:hypothetical protein